MKKISEMTEDEVRDYALQLEQEKAGFEQKEIEYKSQIDEVNGLNKALQKRNNELFLKVEQQGTQDHADPVPNEDQQTESCEDFARRLVSGGNK